MAVPTSPLSIEHSCLWHCPRVSVVWILQAVEASYQPFRVGIGGEAHPIWLDYEQPQEKQRDAHYHACNTKRDHRLFGSPMRGREESTAYYSQQGNEHTNPFPAVKIPAKSIVDVFREHEGKCFVVACLLPQKSCTGAVYLGCPGRVRSLVSQVGALHVR